MVTNRMENKWTGSPLQPIKDFAHGHHDPSKGGKCCKAGCQVYIPWPSLVVGWDALRRGRTSDASCKRSAVHPLNATLASSTHPHLFCEGRARPLIVHGWLPQPPEADRKEYVQSARNIPIILT